MEKELCLAVVHWVDRFIDHEIHIDRQCERFASQIFFFICKSYRTIMHSKWLHSFVTLEILSSSADPFKHLLISM